MIPMKDFILAFCILGWLFTAYARAAETAYWLVAPEGVERRRELIAFKEWLIEETARFRATDA